MRDACGAIRLIVAIGLTLWMAGCGGGGAPIAASVGSYGTPPPGAAKVRVGVTELKVEATPTTEPVAIAVGASPWAPATWATSPPTSWRRCWPRAGGSTLWGGSRSSSRSSSRGWPTPCRPGAVRPAKVNGVEYILVGTLSNLSVTKKPATPSTFGKMKSWVQQSSQNKQVQVAATCNVGIKLVEPSTGDVVLSNNTQFARTGPASSMGLDVLQVSASQSGELPVSQDDREQVVRLALDDAVRKSLPKIDRFLQSRGGLEQAAPTTQPAQPLTPTAKTTPPPAPAARTQPPAAAPSNAPAPTAMKICPSCGAANDPAAKFCRKCGGNLSPPDSGMLARCIAGFANYWLRSSGTASVTAPAIPTFPLRG